MSLFEVELEKNVKVVNVEGLKHIPVKRWDVVTDKKERSKLKVWCDYGLEVSPKENKFLLISGWI